MLPSEFSAYIKQKEQVHQSRILPMPFIDNNNNNNNNNLPPPPPPISSPSSAVIRPPNYRNYYNPYSGYSQMNSSIYNSNDLSLRLPLTNGQSSMYIEQQITSSTS